MLNDVPLTFPDASDVQAKAYFVTSADTAVGVIVSVPAITRLLSCPCHPGLGFWLFGWAGGERPGGQGHGHQRREDHSLGSAVPCPGIAQAPLRRALQGPRESRVRVMPQHRGPVTIGVRRFHDGVVDLARRRDDIADLRLDQLDSRLDEI